MKREGLSYEMRNQVIRVPSNNTTQRSLIHTNFLEIKTHLHPSVNTIALVTQLECSAPLKVR